jgi:hypothetical protein
MHRLPAPQCHTNVIAVFGELSAGSPCALPVASAPKHAAPKQQQQGREGCPGLESLPSPLLLASRSQRRLRSGKLRRMALVIAVALSLTALLYTLVGEPRAGRQGSRLWSAGGGLVVFFEGNIGSGWPARLAQGPV